MGLDAGSGERRSRRISVRLALALALLGTSVPVLAGFLYADLAAKSSAESTARATAARLARVAAAGVEDFIVRSRRLMREVATRPLMAELRAGRCDPLVTEVPRLHPEYANIGIIDLAGRVHCSKVRQQGLADISGSAWFREVSRTERFTVGAPFVGPITHRWVSVLALPLREDGRVAGYLALPVDLVDFQAPFRNLSLPADSVIGAVDRGGAVVARSPAPATWVGRPAPDFTPAAALSGAVESSFRGADGIRRLVGFAPVPGTTWLAYAGVSESWALAPARRIALGVGVAAAAAIGVGALIAVFLTRRIVRPIRRLGEAAALVAGGDYAARAPVEGPAEVALAAQQFNEMVAARVEAEEERRQLAQRLAQSQKLEALGQLAGGVAHDFNNVLTAITGYVAHALALADRPELRDDLSETARAAEMAAAMTAQLLAFSRQAPVQPQVIDLADSVAASTVLLQRLLGDDVTLDVALPGEPAYVRADRAQLQQVVLNLAINARQAMPHGGAVSIRLGRREEPAARVAGGRELPAGCYAELVVCDTGPGIAPEDVERIFEPFFTTKDETHGTGLGLANVRSIVHESDGAIWYEDAPGGGACFRILLPVTGPPEEPPAEPEAESPEAAGERVLVVEDAHVVRNVVELMLQAGGCEAIAVDGPDEALRLLRAGGPLPDAVLSDWTMPGFGSGDFVRAVRALHPELPIVVMSGNLVGETADGEEPPFDDFVQKPFSTDALVDAVRRSIARSRTR